MPVLKFETKLIDGKTNITYQTEKAQLVNKRFGYRTKSQKYPLRNQKISDPLQNDGKLIPERTKFLDDQQKKTTKELERHYQPLPPSPQNFGEEVNINYVKKPKVLNIDNSKNQKESLFNFLNKDENNRRINHKSLGGNSSGIQNRNANKSFSDTDLDELMRQVATENKDLLSEDQLIDLLASIYLKAKSGEWDISRESTKVTVEPLTTPVMPTKINKESTADVIVPVDDALQTSNGFSKMTIMEKKRLQWEKERQEMSKLAPYNPWGKPGCGAPTKSPWDSTDAGSSYRQSLPHQQKESVSLYQAEVSVNVNPAPETNSISLAEQKRRQWLSELNDQVAERERERSLEKRVQKLNISEAEDFRHGSQGDTSPAHGRGKGLASLSQISEEELVQRRNKQLQQQEAIRQQIEEKEIQKRLEKEKKARLDQEEEERINREKQMLNVQHNIETARNKEKDDETSRRFAVMKEQLEAAERAALLDKKLKRLQKLEMAGHDTKNLRAGIISDQLTDRYSDRLDIHSEDELVSRNSGPIQKYQQPIIFSPRIPQKYVLTDDHGVQTDNGYDGRQRRHEERHQYDDNRDDYSYSEHNRRVKDSKQYLSAKEKNPEVMDTRITIRRRARTPSGTTKKQTVKRKTKVKAPEPIEFRQPWGVKKTIKQYIPQSKRDPFYISQKDARDFNKHERVNRILAQVKANIDHIPDNDVNDGQLSQRHKRCDDRPDVEYGQSNHNTYMIRHNVERLSDEEYSHRQNNHSVERYDRQDPPKSQRDKYKQSMNEDDSWFYDDDHRIVRTTDVLDPALADQRLAISRENTGREKARQGYYKNINPAHFGETFQNMKDTQVVENKNTFYMPQGHPTSRQNAILKQLSDIREGLLMKQREIETSLSINDDI